MWPERTTCGFSLCRRQRDNPLPYHAAGPDPSALIVIDTSFDAHAWMPPCRRAGRAACSVGRAYRCRINLSRAESPQTCGRGHTAIFRIVNGGVEDVSNLVGGCGRPIASPHHQRRGARGRAVLLGATSAGIRRSRSDGSPRVESACGSFSRSVTFPERVAHSKAILAGESDGGSGRVAPFR